MPPGSTPTRPTPDLEILGKIVRLLHPHGMRQKEIASHRRDPRMISILIAKIGTEFEKAPTRQTIVFQDDPLLDLLEKPGLGGIRAAADSKILLLKEGDNFALPIRIGRDLARASAKFRIGLDVWAGRIRSDEETSRTHFAQRGHYFCGHIRAIKDDQ